MKKFLAVLMTAAAPAQDTWVLRWDGYDYYVKAGSLDYTPIYVDGEMYSDSQKSRFVAAMYEAICDKLIYHR